MLRKPWSCAAAQRNAAGARTHRAKLWAKWQQTKPALQARACQLGIKRNSARLPPRLTATHRAPTCARRMQHLLLVGGAHRHRQAWSRTVARRGARDRYDANHALGTCPRRRSTPEYVSLPQSGFRTRVRASANL